MLFYYWIGCIMYSDVLEGWSTLDAMYFLTYTMTTVKYQSFMGFGSDMTF